MTRSPAEVRAAAGGGGRRRGGGSELGDSGRRVDDAASNAPSSSPAVPLDNTDSRRSTIAPSVTHAVTSAFVIVTSRLKGSPYSITELIPELIPVLGSQPAGDVSHKPGGRLPLLSARPAVTLAMTSTNVAA